MLSMHIFLVGMPGSGKSSLGRKVAADLGAPFVDTDHQVTKMMGMSEVQIIKSLGEEFYHNTESGVLMSLIGEEPSIVSTGGGLATYRENVQLMQNHGVIIHIDRPLDQILADARTERLHGRPGLPIEEIIYQYNQRIGFYKACADYTLDNSHGYAAGVHALTQLILSASHQASNLLDADYL